MLSVVSKILNGELDDNLNEIQRATTHRRKAISTMKFFTFEVGDRIKLSSTIRPIYLRNCLGTVTAIRRTKIEINLDHPTGRFHRGVICPPGILEKI